MSGHDQLVNESMGQIRTMRALLRRTENQAAQAGSPAKAAAKQHLAKALSLLERDMGSSGSLPSLSANRRSGGSTRRDVSDGSPARHRTKVPRLMSPSIGGAAMAPPSMSSMRTSEAASTTRSRKPHSANRKLRTGLVKLNEYLDHKRMRPIDLLRFAMERREGTRSEGPYLGWISGCVPNNTTHFMTDALKKFLCAEVEGARLDLRRDQIDAVCACLDRKGFVEYTVLQQCLSRTYLQSLANGSVDPMAREPEIASGPKVKSVRFNPHKGGLSDLLAANPH